jgi:peptidoglycan/xylan/chitin deacetylase (PgdA/CDA1 family)
MSWWMCSGAFHACNAWLFAHGRKNISGIKKNKQMNRLIVTILSLILCQHIHAQKQVAITIDDIPNTTIYPENGFRSRLLSKLDSLSVPVTVFINEGLIYNTEFVPENTDLLEQWIKRDYVTPGNHTFSHLRYSDAGFDVFTADISKGDSLSRKLAEKYHKPLKYFRFPYNDLGKDSLQQMKIQTFLSENSYISTPFTIESSDWVFNFLYEYYLKQGDTTEAQKTAALYIAKTLEYFDFFDSITQMQYGRSVNQIYLCHDNSLNACCIGILIQHLKEKGYSFISLDEAMKDEVYSQPEQYTGKWGFSWVYRWMSDKNERQSLMQKEPDITDIYELYQNLRKK